VNSAITAPLLDGNRYVASAITAPVLGGRYVSSAITAPIGGYGLGLGYGLGGYGLGLGYGYGGYAGKYY
jgi:hypothetical protein